MCFQCGISDKIPAHWEFAHTLVHIITVLTTWQSCDVPLIKAVILAIIFIRFVGFLLAITLGSGAAARA